VDWNAAWEGKDVEKEGERKKKVFVNAGESHTIEAFVLRGEGARKTTMSACGHEAFADSLHDVFSVCRMLEHGIGGGGGSLFYA